MRLVVPYSWRMSHDFACHSKACAPPPAGTGGSTPGGGGGKAPSEREAQITRLVGTSAERQRHLLSRGWRYDLFGNASPPKATMTGAQARAAILKRLGHK